MYLLVNVFTIGQLVVTCVGTCPLNGYVHACLAMEVLMIVFYWWIGLAHGLFDLLPLELKTCIDISTMLKISRTPFNSKRHICVMIRYSYYLHLT